MEGIETVADDKVLDAFKGFKPKVIQGGKGAETEAEMIARMNKQNKDSVARLKQKKEKDLGDKLKDYDGDPDAMAIGGRAGFGKGDIVTKGIPFAIKELKKRFGKKAITTADKIDRPDRAKLADEFKAFNKRNRKLTEDELDELYEEFDEAVPYPMETVADRGRFLKSVQDEKDYMFQQYKAGRLDPKPGEEGRKKFLQKKMEEMEMSGDKNLMTQDEIEELADFEFRERTMNAQGGRISFSGGGAGFAGNQMEHDDGTGSFGPGPTFKEPTIDTMPQPQLNPMMFNMPVMQRPMPQGIIGLKDGGPPNPGRRNFMKLMAGLASLPVVGKLFKGAKVADKVVQLKNTTTTMPAWFPKFVDRFISKGVGRKVDQDLMQYETKDLPGVKLEVKTDGKIRVEGQNAYNEPYVIDYEPPGYEVVDYSTGKAVKTKGEFAAADTQYFRTGDPREMDYDVDYNKVKDLDDLLGGNSTKLEGFAKGTNKEKYTKGQRAVNEADSRADVYEGPDIDMSDYEDFAKGGLAYMLGE
jgi:hypothetical protein